MEQNNNKPSPAAGESFPRAGWLFSVFKGALIGMGAILPGISGGVLCVVLGIYRPIMNLLQHPLRELKSGLRFFLPILLGFAVGVIGISALLHYVLQTAEVPATWGFVGLILGTMPSLWKEAGQQGRTKGNLVIGALTFAGMFALLWFLKNGVQVQFQPSVWLWAFCGLLWALGFLAPGLSPSSLFFFLGVMEPMTLAIRNLDLAVLLPMGGVLVLSILALSHAVGWLLSHRYAGSMHAILGLAVASTLAILPFRQGQSAVEIVVNILCFAAGCAIALWMERLNQKLEQSGRMQKES